MGKEKKRWLAWTVPGLILSIAAVWVWQSCGVERGYSLVSGNGHIEATEIDVASKIAGRIEHPFRLYCS